MTVITEWIQANTPDYPPEHVHGTYQDGWSAGALWYAENPVPSILTCATPNSEYREPAPTLRINSGADGWTVMRDSTVLFTFNPKITMAEALDILTKLRS